MDNWQNLLEVEVGLQLVANIAQAGQPVDNWLVVRGVER